VVAGSAVQPRNPGTAEVAENTRNRFETQSQKLGFLRFPLRSLRLAVRGLGFSFETPGTAEDAEVAENTKAWFET